MKTTLHGRPALINFANPYPLFERALPFYNAPQVEAVLLAAELKGRPVTVVDVGSSLGDTALLLLQHCGDRIARLDCIDGDPQFHELLVKNLAGTVGVPHLLMLSDQHGEAPELVRFAHQGTASAIGDKRVPAVRLDERIESADMIKIDVDGYDGTVLSGAARLLASHPIVLFEWHPPTSVNVGAGWRQPFEVLERAGYNRFLFFTKLGEFSQTMYGLDWKRIDQLADLCLNSKTLSDWHFDILAMKDNDNLISSIAGLERWAGAR